MNWYRHPELVDQLASSYVLGTLQGGARRRFESVMAGDAAMRQAVQDWTDRLSPLLTTLPPVEPRPDLWAAIEARTGIAPPAPLPWWKRWLAPLPVGALAMGLFIGGVAPVIWRAQTTPVSTAQLPQSYVGVLANAQGKPGLIVSSLRHGRTVDIKQISPVTLPAGHGLHLWRIDKDGQAAPLGFIPEGKFVSMSIADTAEKVFFPAVELAVSVEPAGSAPTAPALPYVYRGLCGKLWK